MKTQNRHTSPRLALLVLAVLITAGAAEAQLDQTCTVAVLNRTARVDANGFWSIANVPTNAGQVRARATCVKNGVTSSGVSGYFTVPLSGVVLSSTIELATPAPVPASMRLTASRTTMNAGQTVQLSAVITNAGGSQQNVSAAATGTTYTTSSATVITVSSDGLATAVANGVVLVSALNEGALGLLRLTVGGPLDTDGDGMPDDFELGVGLDPNDPSDGTTDLDGDGLTNFREFEIGTDLNDDDTDDDGVRDGLETQLDTDPLDPDSYDLARALRRVDVTPASVLMRTNPLFGETTQQLTVIGRMLDGFDIDLTSSQRGTNYSSSDFSVCGFGGIDGLIFAGEAGTCTIDVSSNGFELMVPVVVEAFGPRPLGVVQIPGYANNVKVRGGHAFVAAGGAGLQVVSLADRSAPVVVASLSLPGVAIDLRIRGDFVYIAGGEAGLHIVSIASATAPVLVHTVDTPGTAQDVWLEGNVAYVADGAEGLQVIDISAPQSAAIVGAMSASMNAKGVSASGTMAVLAGGEGMGVAIIDVSNPAAPVVRGQTSVAGEPKDVIARGTFAYVAAYTGGLQIVDFSDPDAPFNTGGTGDSFVPRDVGLTGDTAVFAEQLFPNAIPFVDVTDPANPIFQAILDLSSLGDYAGTGLDLDGQFIYQTAEVSFVGDDFGTFGETALMIAQYDRITDSAGIAPTVRIVSPAENDTVIAGELMTVTLEASDDISVQSISVFANGQLAGVIESPYHLTFRAPTAGTSLLLGATAVDFGDNVGQATPVSVTVVPDPLTTVRGTVTTIGGDPVPDATVRFRTYSATTNATGEYVMAGVTTVSGSIVAGATAVVGGTTMIGRSAPAAPVRGGETIAGIEIAPPVVGVVSSTDLDGIAEEIDVLGPLAVVVGEDGLQTVDISNPVVPFGRAILPLNGTPRDVKIFGTHAFVAADQAGLLVFDVSDPAAPALVSTVPGSSGARSLALSGSTLYSASGSGGLQYWNVTNPLAPQSLGTVALTNPIMEVAVHGTLVAVAEEGTPDLYSQTNMRVSLIDVSNPADPVIASTVTFSGDASSLALSELYLFGVTSSFITVFDVTDATSPFPIFTDATDLGGKDLSVSGTFLLSAGSNESGGVTLLEDVILSTAIDLAGVTPTRHHVFHASEGGIAVAIGDPYAYVITRAGDASRLYVVFFNGEPPSGPVDSLAPRPATTTRKSDGGKPAGQ